MCGWVGGWDGWEWDGWVGGSHPPFPWTQMHGPPHARTKHLYHSIPHAGTRRSSWHTRHDASRTFPTVLIPLLRRIFPRSQVPGLQHARTWHLYNPFPMPAPGPTTWHPPELPLMTAGLSMLRLQKLTGVLKKPGNAARPRKYGALAALLEAEVKEWVSEVEESRPPPTRCLLCGKSITRAKRMRAHARTHLHGSRATIWSELADGDRRVRHSVVIEVVRALFNHDSLNGQ